MRFTFALLVALCAALSSPGFADNAKPRVAVVVSSYGTPERENLSYDLEELAQAYLVLHRNGVTVDLVSPKGGALLVHNKKDDLAYMQDFKNNTPALKQLTATIASADADAGDYDAVLVIGGNGAMFDLPTHAATTAFLTSFAANGKPVAAVCHGPAALVNVKLADGSFLVTGKRVNSFTNLEEQAFGGDVIDELPFLLEDELKARGAVYVKNAPMLPYVAVDGTLITAQNPMAVPDATEALLVQLGVTPAARTDFKDEATMKLVQEARTAGAYLIDVALKKEPELYDLNYLALYGFYSYKLASGTDAKRLELEIMQAVGRHFDHPMYAASLIQALMEQGFTAKAQAEFTSFKTRFPDDENLATLADLVSAAQ